MSTSEQQPTASENPPVKRNRPTHARPQAAQSQPPLPTQGAYSGVTQTKADVGATADELRAFIAQSRGKSPQEVLGMIAQSGLARSIALAAALVFGLLVIMTILPYALGDRGKPGKTLPPVAKDTKDDANSSSNAQTAKQASAANSNPPKTSKGDASTDPAKTLGISGMEDPNKTPDDPLDNILDNDID